MSTPKVGQENLQPNKSSGWSVADCSLTFYPAKWRRKLWLVSLLPPKN